MAEGAENKIEFCNTEKSVVHIFREKLEGGFTLWNIELNYIILLDNELMRGKTRIYHYFEHSDNRDIKFEVPKSPRDKFPPFSSSRYSL